MKAYKVFNPDWTCRDFQYKIGETYKLGEEPVWCKKGFHACKQLIDCFNYYDFNPSNKVVEVELSGTIIAPDDEDKAVANEITIVKELSWHEVLDMVNTGKHNSGDWNFGNRNSGNYNSGNGNSGDWNSGNGNSGDWNSGYYNSGNGNSGDWNSGDRNSGFFNTIESPVRIFNKETNVARNEILFPSWFKFALTEFVSYDTATEEERVQYKKEIETCGGFLKTLSYKEAWKRAYDNTTEEERQKVKKLPNWDVDIFEEITGLRID